MLAKLVVRKLQAQSLQQLRQLAPQFAAAAQRVYDQWDENLDEYGGGGVCHFIAEEIASVATGAGFDATIVSAQIGEQHVYCIVRATDGVYEVDISPYLYERGGGYTWQKIQGVTFAVHDIVIHLIDPDPTTFDNYSESI